jgi:hypothetical protein
VNCRQRYFFESDSPLHFLFSCFARSLRYRDWHIAFHPQFDVYVRAALASPYTPEWVKSDPSLRQRFPPLETDQLGPGLIWGRPAQRK